jgi:hypothetical protein
VDISRKKLITGVIFLFIFVVGIFLLRSMTTNEIPPDWESATDGEVTFYYPESFSTAYIHAFDWPPQIMVIEDSFSCNGAGKETERTGETKKVIINYHDYCVTKLVEGAAGSMYTQFAYLREKNNKVFAMTFTIRSSQCLNYDDPDRSLCEKERETFNIDFLIDEIFETIKINNE